MKVIKGSLCFFQHDVFSLLSTDEIKERIMLDIYNTYLSHNITRMN